jgi:hypothetical protein
MKFTAALAIAVAATVAVVSQGYAKECARPDKLAIPNGATASDDAMKATQAKLKPYALAMTAYLHCLQDEIKSGTEEYTSVSDEWTKQAQIFKDTPAK